MIFIFGGAFNPPTVAHKEIYFHIQKSIAFDEFIYLPVSNLYTKRSLVSNFHRAKMIELLIQDLPKARLSDLELEDSDYQGTYQSLVRLQDKYPSQQLSFVIGADNLSKLHKWINAKGLLSEFQFIVLSRAELDIHSYIENDEFLSQFKHNFIILPDFDMSVSSTEFRETFNPDFVTKEVYNYIINNHLYEVQ